jgi:hypothetical protein
MKASVSFEQRVRRPKSINRAQDILRRNRDCKPKWYWRLVEARSYEWDVIRHHIPTAEVYMDSLGRMIFHAVPDVPAGDYSLKIEEITE